MQTVDGTQQPIEYDSLIICTGASPFIPPIEGVEKQGVFTLRDINDGIDITEWIKKTQSAIIVGAGFIGLELSHALWKRGVKTTVIERCSHILPEWFDKDIAEMFHVISVNHFQGLVNVFGDNNEIIQVVPSYLC